MKSKKIMIVHGDNKTVETVVLRELIFKKVLNEMIDEGREIKSDSLYGNGYHKIKFVDGSSLSTYILGSTPLGGRFTHLFLDNRIYSLNNGKQFIDTVLLPFIVPQGKYNDWDTDSKAMSRVFTFDLNERKELEVHSLNGN